MRAALSRTVPMVAALAAVAPTTAAAAPAAAAELGERTLERGDRGEDVRELQELLSAVGVETEADGVFGAETAARVRAYERREDLPVDGRVSPGQVRGMERRAGRAAPPAQPIDPPAGEDAPSAAGDGESGAFPVDGEHRYGDGFGERSGHQGQDVLADCGTPLRAVKDATVRKVGSQASAGRYLVLHDARTGEDYVYMHMSGIDVAAGESVQAGGRVGSVGQSGNATTCHLHLERWTAPGWYAGGSARDPMPLLRSLDGS